MKAISQNMMHSTIATTERYIDLPEKELKKKILSLAENDVPNDYDLETIVEIVAEKVTEKIIKELLDLKQK